MGYLRTTIMRKFTPFDESIEFHKVIAYYILFATVLHTIVHFGNYLTPTMSACPPALALKYLNFTSQGGVGTGDCNFSFWLFGTQPGLTGFVLLLIMLFIYGGANETIRRGSDAQRSAPPPAQAGDRSGSAAKAPVKPLSAAASNTNGRQIYSHSVFFFTHHLFVVFFRAKNAQNIKGTGLGLHIVKRHTEMLNGTLEFYSQPGIETAFTVRLPNRFNIHMTT